MTLPPSPGGPPTRGRASVAGWQGRRRRDLTGPLMVIVGVLMSVTVLALAGVVVLLYPPGTGVSLRLLNYLVPLGSGVGVVFIAVGVITASASRSGRR